MKALQPLINCFLFPVLILFLSTATYSQITKEDYRKGRFLSRYNGLVYHANVEPSWIRDTHHFWYKVHTRKGDEYFLVDADKRTKEQAFDHEKLCEQLNEATGGALEPYSLPLESLLFNGDIDKMVFKLDNARWSYDLSSQSLKKLKDIEDRDRSHPRTYWGTSRNHLGNSPVASPDDKWEAYIKDYNVWIRNTTSKATYQLSYDGSEGDFYSSYIRWSPDSKKLATYKVRPNKKQYINFVESAPDDRLQPKLHKKEYLKPGDALPIKRPKLFDFKEKEQIPVDGDPFKDQYKVSEIQWWEDNRGFTFEFNQRGHQLYQVVEVDAETGNTQILIEEKSNTFVDYSSTGKLFRRDINDGEEIIWTSERDGWNHLYLFNGKTGELKNQITQGEWVVREVEHVDEENREIYFRASGRNDDEDPYLIHYYKVNFDGTGLMEFTPEKANHKATFSADRKYYVDHFSRADKAPETVLRRSTGGEVVMTLEEADISELIEAGWSRPEVFTAKGRNGEKEIWGNIYRPSDFDSSKTYPVIEYIYSGPHDSHVQKSFNPYIRHINQLTELVFIVVQIDGMGTNNRSKEFLDVCWKNLKDAGFPDRIRWIRAAASEYAHIDATEIGIYGSSAGGQSALAALLFYPEFYTVGVAASGSHDNRVDKIWWNEQWMGYPVGPHYEESSNVEHAGNLQGNLMLIVGEMDDNVDPSSTLQVADALIEERKDFELVFLPGEGHTMGGAYGNRKLQDFFVKHLLKQDPPEWNQPGQ
ncbi:MAG: DPP IV N-terminal domain-containing protein [Bacteroidales bacterium]